MGSNNPENSNAIAGALTYPSGSDRNVQRLPEQPRQPRNLQGLLRFAMEATKAEDAPGNSELGPMDEERRSFLEQALRSLTVDMAQVIQEAIRVLTNQEKIRSIQLGQPLPDDVAAAFSNILDYVDDIDVANDFYKMGGFAIFPVCYGCENEEVRAKASSVLAEVCQNNPFCQARALESGLLNVLLNLIATEKGEALTKCVYAVSCACREFEPACRELVAQRVCGVLAALLAAPERAARTKAAFLVRYLAHHYAEAKEQFVECDIIRTIVGQIRAGRDESSEHLLGILQALAEGRDPGVLRRCADPGLGLRATLQQHLSHPDLETDRFREEKEYCEELLKLMDNYPVLDQYEDEADR